MNKLSKYIASSVFVFGLFVYLGSYRTTEAACYTPKAGDVLSSPGTVYNLCPGTFILTRGISVTAPNISIIGDPAGSVIQYYQPSNPGGTAITLTARDFLIDGVTIQSWFEGVSSFGCTFGSCDGAVIKNNIFDDGSYQVYFEGSDIEISNNKFIKASYITVYLGCSFGHICNNSKINKNYIELQDIHRLWYGAIVGVIMLNQDNPSKLADVGVNGNNIKYMSCIGKSFLCGGFGVWLIGTNGLSITKNHINNVGIFGIRTEDYNSPPFSFITTDNVISENYIDDLWSSGSGPSGGIVYIDLLINGVKNRNVVIKNRVKGLVPAFGTTSGFYQQVIWPYNKKDGGFVITSNQFENLTYGYYSPYSNDKYSNIVSKNNFINNTASVYEDYAGIPPTNILGTFSKNYFQGDFVCQASKSPYCANAYVINPLLINQDSHPAKRAYNIGNYK